MLASAGVAVFMVSAVGCSGGSHSSPAVLPDASSSRAAAPLAAPLAAASPPITAPVTIPYPYTSSYTTTTWTSATSKPKVTKGTDDGTTIVQFSLDKKTGIYLVPETIVSKTGYKEVLNSSVGFLPVPGGGVGQVILSDNYTFVQGPFSETGMDTYPQGEAAPDFPLRKNRTWSGAANHTSFYNDVLTGSGAFEQNVSSNVWFDGTYTGQTNFSSTAGSANQDNYASTTNVTLNGSSTYTLAEPAAGYNILTQVFYPPNGPRDAVTSYGVKPIPYKAGTVLMPAWYDPAKLSNVFYADNWQVTGAGTMPSTCGKRTGQAATVVLENSYDVDPVQGTNDSYTATYYMTTLAPGQYWFACIVEDYTDTTYANGWVMSSGHWGKPSSQEVGTEVLIASGAKPSTSSLREVAQLHSLSFLTPVRLRAQVARMGLKHPSR
jgi:hypothetical protein